MIKPMAAGTRRTKIPETIMINIHKTPVMVMEITGIITGITGMAVITGEINMIIHAIIKDGLNIIPTETGTGVAYFPVGLIIETEINNSFLP